MGVNPHYVKGMAEALGINLDDAPPSLLMTTADFNRLQRHREIILKRGRQLASTA